MTDEPIPADAELVRRAQDGSETAFAALYDRPLAALPASAHRGVPASDVHDWDAIRPWSRV